MSEKRKFREAVSRSIMYRSRKLMTPFCYLGVFTLLIACLETVSSDPLNKEQLVKEIKQMLTNYHRDIAKEGLTAEFQYLDQSEDFFWVPPGYNTPLSYDSVRSILENNAKALRLVEFQWDALQVFPLSKEIANYTGIVSGRLTDTAGLVSAVSIIESGTLINRNGAWKLLSGQSAVLNTGPDSY